MFNSLRHWQLESYLNSIKGYMADKKITKLTDLNGITKVRSISLSWATHAAFWMVMHAHVVEDIVVY